MTLAGPANYVHLIRIRLPDLRVVINFGGPAEAVPIPPLAASSARFGFDPRAVREFHYVPVPSLIIIKLAREPDGGVLTAAQNRPHRGLAARAQPGP